MAEPSEGLLQSWDAQLYDDKHSFVWKQAASLLDWLAPQPGEVILDVGCGTGHLTAQIAASGASVVGLDSSLAMIAEARRNYPHVAFEIGDARAMLYVAAFDAVFSNAALHWIPAAESVARGVARALKPGGRFVAEFGGQGNVQQIVMGLHSALEHVGCEPPAFPWYFPSVAAYAGLLEQAGLEVTQAQLFERWTPLEGESGLRHWVTLFAGPFLGRVPAERQEEFFLHLQERLRPVLYQDGTWHADYRRLRVAARRLA